MMERLFRFFASMAVFVFIMYVSWTDVCPMFYASAMQRFALAIEHWDTTAGQLYLVLGLISLAGAITYPLLGFLLLFRVYAIKNKPGD